MEVPEPKTTLAVFQTQSNSKVEFKMTREAMTKLGKSIKAPRTVANMVRLVMNSSV